MEGEIQFCPNCILVPFINIIDKQIHIKCNCGYDKNLQISEYLARIHSNKLSPGTPIDESSLYKSTIKVVAGKFHPPPPSYSPGGWGGGEISLLQLSSRYQNNGYLSFGQDLLRSVPSNIVSFVISSIFNSSLSYIPMIEMILVE